MKLCVAGAVFFGLVFVGPANATSTGSLTSVSVGPPGSFSVAVSMTGTVNFDCAGAIYCGWFPTVDTVDASQPCVKGAIKFVGSSTEQPSTNFAISYSTSASGQERGGQLHGPGNAEPHPYSDSNSNPDTGTHNARL
jgi:hypothetical protein